MLHNDMSCQKKKYCEEESLQTLIKLIIKISLNAHYVNGSY